MYHSNTLLYIIYIYTTFAQRFNNVPNVFSTFAQTLHNTSPNVPPNFTVKLYPLFLSTPPFSRAGVPQLSPLPIQLTQTSSLEPVPYLVYYNTSISKQSHYNNRLTISQYNPIISHITKFCVSPSLLPLLVHEPHIDRIIASNVDRIGIHGK